MDDVSRRERAAAASHHPAALTAHVRMPPPPFTAPSCDLVSAPTTQTVLRQQLTAANDTIAKLRAEVRHSC